MAEWLRRQIRNLMGVFTRVGSNPTAVAAFVAQLAEHSPSKRKVMGSNPVGGYCYAVLAEWSKALRLGRSLC